MLGLGLAFIFLWSCYEHFYTRAGDVFFQTACVAEK